MFPAFPIMNTTKSSPHGPSHLRSSIQQDQNAPLSPNFGRVSARKTDFASIYVISVKNAVTCPTPELLPASPLPPSPIPLPTSQPAWRGRHLRPKPKSLCRMPDPGQGGGVVGASEQRRKGARTGRLLSKWPRPGVTLLARRRRGEAEAHIQGRSLLAAPSIRSAATRTAASAAARSPAARASRTAGKTAAS